MVEYNICAKLYHAQRRDRMPAIPTYTLTVAMDIPISNMVRELT
jgi:hypothetical protein